MRQDVTAARIRTARIVALAADLLQIVLLPAFVPGWASPAVHVIDLLVALAMLRLVGWHWAFLPTFVVELVPFVDLVPTWTAAVFLVTRHAAASVPMGVEPKVPGTPRALPPAGPQAPPGASGS